jgi:XapX domain-containing protein
MSGSTRRRLKVALGLVLGVLIGGLCRLFDVPSPAPSVLTGALLVVAMTAGYVATDRWLARRAPQHRDQCAGPDGLTKSE